jgi:nicotinate phosphoribosyltransferase
MGPGANEISALTDKYFARTKEIVGKFGDCRVTYAIFMRRPVISAPRLMIEWLEKVAKERNVTFDIELLMPEGKWVGAGEPILYLSGSLHHLADLETLYLQLLGPPCVAAWNAFTMCVDLPTTQFLAMDSRHCAGTDMAEQMAYAASVGSRRAQRKAQAAGFIGNATDATAHFFDQKSGFGTMPHALIGYAGSTVRAAEMFHETFPDQALYVLVDYFGLEVTDALAVCRRFPKLAAEGKLGVRLDTAGGRFVEGLDPPGSYAVLERNAPGSIRGYRSEQELRYLVGSGVSAAAIWYMREQLDKAGFPKVKIIASSGFNPAKCKVMAIARAPADIIGTGSFLPESWSETYATSDIIEYDGVPRVKVGREFLHRKKG